MTKTLSKTPGFHEVNLDNHLQELFDYDCQIFDIKPIAFPFDNPAQLREHLLEKHRTKTTIFNDEDGKFIGYFSYEENLEIQNTVELVNIGVLPNYQNKGFGSQLMKEFLKTIGNKNSRLVTHPQSKSKYLYEKFGYKKVKIIENYFGDGEQRVLYFRQGN